MASLNRAHNDLCASVYIGTSGWVYPHWEGIFYPEKLSSKDKSRTFSAHGAKGTKITKSGAEKVRDKLKYFSQHFKTTEVNYSFYRLPKPATYQSWYQQTPKGFLFSLKASRFITHIKRLKDIKNAWETFIKNALNLKEKLGPILFQFPPNFKATEENIRRLKEFLKFIKSSKFQVSSSKLRYAFEFRHESWRDKKNYNLLKKYNVAWVIADSSRYPKTEVVTADFIYIRMHGSKAMFSSKYTKKELEDLARKIKKWQKQRLDVYCYFNNDFQGYAVENAKTLKNLLKTNRTIRPVYGLNPFFILAFYITLV